MTIAASLRPKPSPITACTISRDLDGFARLVDEMEAELADGWADLALADAAAFLRGHAPLKFVVLALDSLDEGNPAIADAIGAAQKTGCRVVLVPHGLAPAAMQAILRLHPDEVLAYPLSCGALRMVARDAANADPLGPTDDMEPGAIRPGWAPRGRVLGVMGMAGGVGATTVAINLASELATNGRVCFMDLTGGGWEAPLSSGIQVVTPQPDAAARMVEFARAEYDFVVLDLPITSTELLENVDTCLAVLRPDIRSTRTLQRLNHQKLRPVLNFAPGLADIAGRRHWARVSKRLGQEVVLQLPDGGTAVTRANDSGLPMSETAARNPMRRAMVRLADILRT